MSPAAADLWAELEKDEAIAALSTPWPVATAEPLGLHASIRRFYRVMPAAGRAQRGAGSLVVVLYEDNLEGVAQYRRTAEWFAAAAVPVPRIFDSSSRALLVEDGGDLMLSDYAGPDTVDLYEQAADIVVALQQHGRQVAAANPEWALDAERLRNELRFTEEHALRGWLEAPAGGKLRERAFDRLAAEVAALPRAICHRDYHSRNLMVTESGLLVVDFQDVMAGPHLYDLASLLRDDYRRVPPEGQRAALHRYWKQAAVELPVADAAAVPAEPAELPPAARQSFCLTAAQRSLKALGTFGYQVTVAGGSGYASYGAGTWKLARESLAALGWDDLVADLRVFDRLL